MKTIFHSFKKKVIGELENHGFEYEKLDLYIYF